MTPRNDGLLNDFWYPACAQCELPETPLAIQIGSLRLVLFREAGGRSRALLDRCCHRGFPLSRGTRTSAGIACGFHGWEYDSAGRCVRIPSQAPDAEIPASYAIPRFPCEERDGYVWVWIGSREPTPLRGIPEFAQGKWLQGNRVLACSAVRALEINFDTAHLYFVHPNHPATIAARASGFAPTRQELRLTELGCRVFAPVTDFETQPMPDPPRVLQEFMLPGTITYKSGGFFLHLMVLPLSERSCRIHFLFTNFAADAAQSTWIGPGAGMMDEDQVVLELTAPAYDETREPFEKSVEADVPPLMLRRILEIAASQQWDPLLSSLPGRTLITLMGPASVLNMARPTASAQAIPEGES